MSTAPSKKYKPFCIYSFYGILYMRRRGLQWNQFMKWKEDIELVLFGLFPYIHDLLKTKMAKIKYGMTEHEYQHFKYICCLHTT